MPDSLSTEAMWYFFKLSAFGSSGALTQTRTRSWRVGHGHGGRGTGVVHGRQHHGRHGESRPQQPAALEQGSRNSEALHAEEPRAVW